MRNPRFADACRITARRTPRRPSIAATHTLEPLERRVLLSAVSSDHKRLTYTDVDGDQVTLALHPGPDNDTIDVGPDGDTSLHEV